MRPRTPERPAVRENLPVRGLAVVGAATGDLIQRHGRDLPDDAYDFAGGNAHLRPPGADGRAQLGRHDRRRPRSSRGGAAGRPGDPRRRRPSTSRPAGSGLDGVIDCWRTRRPPPSPSPLLRPIRRRGGRTTRSAATLTVAVPRPGRFGDLTRPAGHHPLNIRSGRRYGSPPVSRSQAARAATGPLMRTFLGEVRTAPVRCAGGRACGRAGFRSSPPATSERDHSTR